MHETLIWQKDGYVINLINLHLNLSTQWPITPLMPPKHKEIAGHVLNKYKVQIHNRLVMIFSEAIYGYK